MFLPFKVEGFEFEVEMLNGKIAATEADQVVAELAEMRPPGSRVRVVEDQFPGNRGVLESEPLSEFVGDGFGQYFVIIGMIFFRCMCEDLMVSAINPNAWWGFTAFSLFGGSRCVPTASSMSAKSESNPKCFRQDDLPAPE